VLAALPARLRHRLATAMEGEILGAMRRPPAEFGLPRRLIEELSYWLLVALFNVFPLPKRTGFRQSFAFAGETVDRGYSILVFPEGKRTRDGRMSPFQAGIGLLADNLNLPVVPIRIDGLFELKRAGRRFAPPGAITVSIGEPVRFAPETAPEQIARDLQERVERLNLRSERGG
ncbi:MAG: 1-acyl-sn-glycerol-3-phosphate acyltransferase, partial [Acidobacteria bacterium]|nr:1-acyl-sn-glycerol-3-phosphate acyltransferase [Acidobacteriota bacterium]